MASRPVKSRFGLTMSKLCNERRLSQEELAKQPDLQENYPGGVERCERGTGLEHIVTLAEVLPIPPKELFTDFQ